MIGKRRGYDIMTKKEMEEIEMARSIQPRYPGYS